jgi:hypothetical protein
VSISEARCDQPVTAFLQRDSAYQDCTCCVKGELCPKTRARRYLIEIKDAKGVVLFSSAAHRGESRHCADHTPDWHASGQFLRQARA